MDPNKKRLSKCDESELFRERSGSQKRPLHAVSEPEKGTRLNGISAECQHPLTSADNCSYVKAAPFDSKPLTESIRVSCASVVLSANEKRATVSSVKQNKTKNREIFVRNGRASHPNEIPTFLHFKKQQPSPKPFFVTYRVAALSSWSMYDLGEC